MTTHRGRYAPTPTGPLHLGNARTALLAWLAARAGRSSFVMRIEDLDQPRMKAGMEARVLGALRWLGLDWDEGPDAGGPHAPYRQSKRRALYDAALEALRAKGLVYPCFCTRSEVAAAAVAPHAGEEVRYPGTCRALTAGDIAERSKARQPAWRLSVEPGELAFDDAVHGRVACDVAREVGDFVVMRNDGVPAYQLAVVVDDAAMQIEEVVRGDDLLSSTARQLLLYRALGLAAPRFAHVPLVVGEDGARLAKRHGALSLDDLAVKGVAPERVVGLLASLSGLGAPGGRRAARDLVAGFSLASIPRGPAVLTADAVASLR